MKSRVSGLDAVDAELSPVSQAETEPEPFDWPCANGLLMEVHGVRAACSYAADDLNEAVNDQRRCAHLVSQVHQPTELPYALVYLRLVEYSIAVQDVQGAMVAALEVFHTLLRGYTAVLEQASVLDATQQSLHVIKLWSEVTRRHRPG